MPRDYKMLLAVRFCFVFAVQMQAVVLGWQMYVLTNNAYFLGLIGLAEAIPALGFALYAGYYVDHRRPLPVLFKLLFVSLCSAALMLFGQSEASALSLELRISALFVSSVLTGAVRAFAHPTLYTLIPGIVPRELLSKAAAISASTMQIARISGPAVGGILYGYIGISKTASVVVALLVCALCFASSIRTSPEPSATRGAAESLTEKLLAGLRYVWRHPILYPAMTLDMVSVFLGGVTALLPIYVSDILHASSQELGFLRAAPSIGAAIMAIVLVRVPPKGNAGKAMFAAVIGFGVSICVFALSNSLILSILALVSSGMFDSLSVVIRTSVIQLCSPDSIRGRISSVNSIFVSSSNELGEFESGILAGLVGAVPAALFGGVACIITALVMIPRYPRLRCLDLRELTASERGEDPN